MSRFERSLSSTRLFAGVLLVVVLAATVGGKSACADIVFDTQLMTMNLSGGPFPLPLASDPVNGLPDSIEGYGFVNSDVTITLSSQRAVNPGPSSLGQAIASGGPANGTPGQTPPMIDPNQLDGGQFFVDSFFDVFFDITVTDVDPRPGRDYAGQPHGVKLDLPDNGPFHMESSYSVVFDKDAPNFGLIPPPEAFPYIGFTIEIPLGGDINGNGENDKVKFTRATHSVGDENREFIRLPDGTVLEKFDSAAFLEGAVVDESTDPPFTIGTIGPLTGLPDPNAFGGPTTATSQLQNPVLPEPSTLALLSMGTLALLAYAWRRRPKR